MKNRFLPLFAVLLLGCALPLCAASAQPNIVLIMADDLGYETLGSSGGTSYATPQLDALAKSGVRFTHFYAQPLCTPTRVQLMTGQYNVRNYIDFGNMDPNSVTFANLLKKAGYATCMAGKWQLGKDKNLPAKFGFDQHCLWQHTRRPPRYANPGLEIDGVEKDFSNGEYGPDIVNAFALNFIEQNKDKPFFLYYPMILTHDPYQPTPDSADWNPKAVGEKANVAEKHFGDMVEYTDKLVGKVVAKLEALGLRDNTLLIFLGDNGTGKGAHSKMGSVKVAGGKGLTNDRGMHVPFIANWPGRIPSGSVFDGLSDTTDVLPTLLETAGVAAPPGATLDGRSLFPHLTGKGSAEREWLYCWYSPRQNSDKTVHEFAYTAAYKLCRDGRFFDLRADPEEKNPLSEAERKGAAAQATAELRKVLDRFKDARPARLE
jgi:arylsulfatase A